MAMALAHQTAAGGVNDGSCSISRNVFCHRLPVWHDLSFIRPQVTTEPMTNTDPRDLIKRLANALDDAADDVEGWGNYASSYFQEKHDLSGNVARIHAQAEEARAYLAQPDLQEHPPRP